MYYSTAGDSINGERYNHYKWAYYMLGAGGEQLAVYKGVQAAHEDSSGHMGRRVYMYNESYISLGGTLVTLPDNTKQFNAMDNIGSVRLTVSAKEDSIRIQSFDYKPFGDTLNAEDESRIGYASQERDEESRYFAMGARQYDPLAGRFLSVDPLYESFPDKTPYHYCNNNPISFKDPSGLSPEGEKGKEDEVQVVDTYSSMQESEFSFQIMLDFMEEQENWQRNFRDQIFAWSHMNDAQSDRMRDFGGGGSGGGGFDNSGGERTGEQSTGENSGTATNGLIVNGTDEAKEKFNKEVEKGSGGLIKSNIDPETGQVVLEESEGPVTKEQSIFIKSFKEACDMTKRGVEFNVSEENSDVIFFNQVTKTMDIDDISNLGDGEMINSTGTFIHEIVEQTCMQRYNMIRDPAHGIACRIEESITGWERGDINFRVRNESFDDVTWTGNAILVFRKGTEVRNVIINYNHKNIRGITR